jgi:serine/threonine protein kinase
MAGALGMMVQQYEMQWYGVAALITLLVALVAIACCLWRWWHTRISTQILKGDAGSVSMHMVPLGAPKQQETLLSSGGSPVTVRSDEPTQLEVVDFSTLTMGRPIGEGGYATVWSARWQGNDLAVKVLKMKLENMSSAQEEEKLVMLQEVAILRRLRHPCICALFGHLLVDRRPALVLEYMAGGSLAAHLFNPRPASCNVPPPAPVAPQGLDGCQMMEPPPPHLAGMLSDDKKICFAVQLASGLCFLHSHGILHHDIKTDNALLDANHSVCKLADFGLASLSLNYAQDRNKRIGGGTLRYLAPERLAQGLHESRDRDESRGSSSLSLSLGRTLVSFEDRADVYAFAFLLWELTHERRAFKELTGAAAASSALKGLRPQLSNPSHSQSDGIPAVTCECWAQRPEDRPSMSTVLERLETCLQALSRPNSTSTQMWPQCSDPSSSSALSCSNESRRAELLAAGFFSAKLGGSCTAFE